MTEAKKASTPGSQSEPNRRITIERKYQASLRDVWDLWTTKRGFESWWGPGGFTARVSELDLRPGGELRYAMTATGREQIEFMKSVGMPLTVEAQIRFTEVVHQKRLAYTHLADFIPGVQPYDVPTQVEFQEDGKEVRMIVTFDAMHSEEWTERARMGWESQLSKLSTIFVAQALSPRVI
jgi:uncharacterized protein YndB with AHSA1/START domain